MLTILFDGIAYGMLLFLLSVGLSVTLGMMNFVNLAHGVFAMTGGYVTTLLMNRLGVPFLLCLPLALLLDRMRSVGVLPASPGGAERAARLALMERGRNDEGPASGGVRQHHRACRRMEHRRDQQGMAAFRSRGRADTVV